MLEQDGYSLRCNGMYCSFVGTSSEFCRNRNCMSLYSMGIMNHPGNCFQRRLQFLLVSFCGYMRAYIYSMISSHYRYFVGAWWKSAAGILELAAFKLKWICNESVPARCFLAVSCDDDGTMICIAAERTLYPRRTTESDHVIFLHFSHVNQLQNLT